MVICARGTCPHRKIGRPDALPAIATWESATARQSADAVNSEQVRRIISEQAELVEVHVLGEDEVQEWVVLPAAES